MKSQSRNTSGRPRGHDVGSDGYASAARHMLWELLCHEGVGHGLVVLHGRAVRLCRDSRGEHVV